MQIRKRILKQNSQIKRRTFRGKQGLKISKQGPIPPQEREFLK